ncbi:MULTISPECIES: hypothetical protein [unclassified Streptomyces]|uniref:hypothetical protein n=1 Tax=unclassified Streptomyces TaxID=2593676 RepID=UPI0034268F2A
MVATRKALALAVACIGTATALAGCSGGDARAGAAGGRKEPVAATGGATSGPFRGLTADRIADRALTTTRQAGALRMKGGVRSEGEAVTVDLAMDDRDNCTGHLGVRGGRADLRRLSSVLYIKGDAAFWRASMGERAQTAPGGGGETLVELMKDRWIRMPPGAVEGMRGVCDLDETVARLDEDRRERPGMTLGEETEIDGVPAVALVRRTGYETTTAYVATEGRPYLLRVVKAGGDEPGTLTFSGFDRPVEVSAPPAGEIVDLEELGGADPFDAGPSGEATEDPGEDPGSTPPPESDPAPDPDPYPSSDGGTGEDPDIPGDTGTGPDTGTGFEAATRPGGASVS